MYKLGFSDGTSIKVKIIPEWKVINVKGIYSTAIIYKLGTDEFSSLDKIKEYFNDETKTSAVNIFTLSDDDDTIQTKLDTAEGYTKLHGVIIEDDSIINVIMIKGTSITEIINELSNKVKELESKIETLEKEKKEAIDADTSEKSE